MRVAFVTTSDLDAIDDDVDLPLQLIAFANAGIDIDFGSSVPNGEIVLTQIYLQPDSMPAANFACFFFL